MTRGTELFDRVTAACPELYEGLREAFLSNDRGKTCLTTAGLTGSGKTTLTGQLLFKLSQDPDVIAFCAQKGIAFTVYYLSFGQGISYAKAIHPDLITTEHEPFQPQEYDVVSSTMMDIVLKCIEYLPSPAVVVFDSVNVTALVNDYGELDGVDRGTSVARTLAQDFDAFTVAVVSPLELRLHALMIRDRIRDGESPSAVLKSVGLRDDETDQARLTDLYSKTGTRKSLAGNDRNLNSLVFQLIESGVMPHHDPHLSSPEDFMKDQYSRMIYLRDHYYPLWMYRIYGNRNDRGFVVQNSQIEASLDVKSSILAMSNMIEALRSKNLLE